MRSIQKELISGDKLIKIEKFLVKNLSFYHCGSSNKSRFSQNLYQLEFLQFIFCNIKLFSLVNIFIIINLGMVSCSNQTTQRVYVVKKGDTVYSIARKHRAELQRLVKLNNINSTYKLHPGQKLLINKDPAKIIGLHNNKAINFNKNKQKKIGSMVDGGNQNKTFRAAAANPNQQLFRSGSTNAKQQMFRSGVANPNQQLFRSSVANSNPKQNRSNVAAISKIVNPKSNNSTTTSGVANVANNFPKISWGWPASGKIIKSFMIDPKVKFNGIDIAGRHGDKILSASHGKVVYVGNSLRGYGNLIIIKHDQDFLSAYAHNHKILVKEQQIVVKGQQIATMGNTDAKIVKLHFQVRFKGKPVDPLKFLPKL